MPDLSSQAIPALTIASAITIAKEKETVLTAAKIALIVGPILILINQWEALFSDQQPNWGKAMLTLVVPYCVSTWTAIRNKRQSN